MAFGRKSSHSSDHSKSGMTASRRRGGTRWSASMKSVTNQLHRVSEPRNLKSCMKVHTLEDSIRSCEPRRQISARVKGVKYETSNPLKPSPSHDLLVGTPRRGLNGMGKSLRSISFPHWLSSRKHGQFIEDKSLKAREPDLPVSESSKSPVMKQVKFATLQFREYNILAGTNPGVSKGGPALELGWEHKDERAMCVDDFELARGTRKTLKEIKVSKEDRIRRLRESGVSEKELRESAKKVNMAKAKRKKTLEMINSSGAEENEEMKENIKYNFRRLFRLEKSASRREDELWDNANKGSLITNSRAA